MPTILAVSVKPGAKSGAISLRRGMVDVRVREPAREGKANDACRRMLANALDVPLSTVELLRGARSRVKVFAIHSLSPPELSVRLSRLRR